MSNSLQPYRLSLPGSSVHGILQARILEWVAMFPLGDPPNAGIEPKSPPAPMLQVDFFFLISEPLGKPSST